MEETQLFELEETNTEMAGKSRCSQCIKLAHSEEHEKLNLSEELNIRSTNGRYTKAYVLLTLVVFLACGSGTAVFIVVKRGQEQKLDLHDGHIVPTKYENINPRGAIETTLPTKYEKTTSAYQATEDSIRASHGCPSDWIIRESSCYAFSKDAKTWKKAAAACTKTGGHLVEIADFAEDRFLRLFARNLNDGFWIGLSYQNDDGGWIWSGSINRLTPTTYKNWASGQSDIEINRGGCALLSKKSSFLWNEADCHTKNRYICEINLR